MSTPTHPHPPATTGNSDKQRRAEAREYVRQVRACQVHAMMFTAGMVVIFLVNLFTNKAAGIDGGWSSWWSAWALIGWGLGVAVHGFVVQLSRPESSSAREVRQIEKVLTAMGPESC